MRFPWIARWRYDAATEAVSVFNHIIADYKAMVISERERYNELLERYHALKLQGAVAPPPVVQYTPKEADPYDELKALIAEQAGTDLRRRGMMLRQLKKDREDGIPPEKIRRSIETGIVPDGVPA